MEARTLVSQIHTIFVAITLPQAYGSSLALWVLPSQ